MPRFYKFRPEGAPANFFCEVPDGAEPADFGVPEDAIEVDRMPGEFEDHDDDGNWSYDADGHAEDQESARLRGMTPAQRHAETEARAVERVRGEMAAEMAAAVQEQVALQVTEQMASLAAANGLTAPEEPIPEA